MTNIVSLCSDYFLLRYIVAFQNQSFFRQYSVLRGAYEIRFVCLFMFCFRMMLQSELLLYECDCVDDSVIFLFNNCYCMNVIASKTVWYSCSVNVHHKKTANPSAFVRIVLLFDSCFCHSAHGKGKSSGLPLLLITMD